MLAVHINDMAIADAMADWETFRDFHNASLPTKANLERRAFALHMMLVRAGQESEGFG